ncbi:polyketide synthesis O-methyltransferase [Anaeromyces robustus]|uniref:Polyketide synthesis O-methyltransferase n=1 Tax=Anaeromyces robustus TaxID=1754192 RepID=A0A1Y1XHF2_9FUNG|nr:polyketide synthesis O-methyltransferase [Anaeromyces robustus]|eukprot:ORX84814.1 polyketide synthesis O-methyltransferase [Anaeromyces robustus]
MVTANATEKISLGTVQETLLIPLYFRAKETKKENGSINDPQAVELVDKIDYDFSKFDRGKASELGIISRTVILDNEVQKYIDEHPDCVIVNLGCGLCTRNLRLDLKQTKWYNLDFPDVIEVRKKFLKPKENCYDIAKSCFDETWPNDVNAGNKDKDVLIISEGVFMYFTEDEVKQLIQLIKKNFKKTTLYIEIMHSLLARHTNMHDTVTKTNATLGWGISQVRDMAKFDPGLKYITEWNFLDKMADLNDNLFIKISSKVNFFKNFCNKYGVFELTQ